MRHLLIMADSCFAGAEGTLSPGDHPLKEVLKRQSRLVMASGNQTYIADNSGDGHSAFATALIDSLKQNRSVITAAELFQGLQEVVPKLAERQEVEQNPTFAPLPNSNDEGGMFVFVPRESKIEA